MLKISKMALASPIVGGTLKTAAAIKLGPKYQEGYVLGRQGIRKSNSSRLAGAPIHLRNSLRCFHFLDAVTPSAMLTIGWRARR